MRALVRWLALAAALLPDSARALAQAAQTLREQGFRLKAYDCYRPLSVQWEMWKVMPRPGYVADPKMGSNHNRGAAVDLTLATREGKEVEMPTEFDTFSRASHHGFDGGTHASRRHREIGDGRLPRLLPDVRHDERLVGDRNRFEARVIYARPACPRTRRW